GHQVERFARIIPSFRLRNSESFGCLSTAHNDYASHIQNDSLSLRYWANSTALHQSQPSSVCLTAGGWQPISQNSYQTSPYSVVTCTTYHIEHLDTVK